MRSLVKKTPIYSVVKAINQMQEVKAWEKRGKPAPPPHIIKQRTIRSFAKRFELKVLIETGTFYGDMVEAMKKYFDRIYSIELSEKLYERARQRFSRDKRIKIIHGDSGIELGKLMVKIEQPALFWLDGHYSAGETARGDKDTPVYEELTHIFNAPQNGHVIIIDDARCFGTDPAYPSLEELTSFVRGRVQNVKIEIENDSIRIFPLKQRTL